MPLVYVGSTLLSWGPSEIGSAALPHDGYERAILMELTERYRLEPVVTFPIQTADFSGVWAHLTAGRRTEVELGFYRPVPLRESEH